MNARPGRWSSVRALILLMATGAGLYVVALGAYVLLNLAPAAQSLRTRAGVLASEYDSLQVQTQKLEAAFEQVRRWSANGHPAPPDHRAIRVLRPEIAALAAQSAGVQASLLLTHIPIKMRVSLAEAAGIESRVAGMLIEALTDLEAGDRSAAARWVALADTARQTMIARLGDAQQLGLVDLADRERVLGERATRVGRGVVLWFVLGAALVGLAFVVLQRRFYAPLAQLDGGLARVAQGDLDASLPVRHDDELGRLAAHFNEMTGILRARPEVEALRRSEVRFRSLIEHGMDLISIIGPDGRLLYTSPAATRLLGYGATELLGAAAFDYVHPDDRARVEAAFTAALAGGDMEIRQEFQLRHRDGSWRSFEAVVTNLVDEPTVAGLVINSRDVTERKDAQLALQRSEESFALIFSLAPVAISISDLRDGRLIDVNEEYVTLLGYPREDVIGRTSTEIGIWLDPADRERLVAAVTAGGTLKEYRLPLRTADGRHREMRGAFHRVEMDGRDVLLAAFVDVTERQEAQRRLQESEERFRTAFMTGSDAYVITEWEDGRIVEMNEQFEAMFGYRRAEAIGRTSIELGLWADPQMRTRALAQVTAEGRVVNFETLARRKGGTTFQALYSGTPLEAGPRRLLMSVVRDVSEQKRSAEALRSLEEQYRQAQRLEAVGRLAGGVAHDFNNILTAITGYTELLLDDFRGNDPRRSDLEEIRSAAQRAAALTRQLLAFSRKQVLQPRVLDLNDVLRALEKMLRRVIGEDVDLAFRPGAPLGAVRADPGQIEQVILNLAVNARDAMPGGGRLTIETANVDLDAGYVATHAEARPGPHVLVAVSDTGTGIDREMQEHIFEPFFTTKELGKGTGLGLATVHGVVTQSGGHVAVYSETGHGTTFKIYLPRVEEPVETSSAPFQAPVARGGRETVLVAEDDRAVRDVVAETLTQRGYTVLRAPDGQTALELARGLEGGVDLLLTDIVMPGMTGRELAQALAAEHPDLRVLYMSGYTDDAVVRHGVLEQGTPYLQKPFAPDVLALKVREVLDRT